VVGPKAPGQLAKKINLFQDLKENNGIVFFFHVTFFLQLDPFMLIFCGIELGILFPFSLCGLLHS